MITLRNILITLFFFISFLKTISGKASTDHVVVDTALVLDSIRRVKIIAREYSELGDFDKTIESFKKVNLLSSFIYPKNSKEHANNYINISIAFRQIWEYDSSLYYLNKAEDIYLAEKEIESGFISNMYSNFGRLYFMKGDLIHARRYFEKALNHLTDLEREPFITYATILFNRIGILNNAEGNFKAAIEYFNTSLDIARSENNISSLIMTYLNLALPYAGLKEFDKSIEIQRKAIELCLTDSVENVIRLGKLYNNLSLDFLELGDLNHAEHYLTMSLKIAQSNPRQTKYLSDIYDSYGRLYERKKELDLALESYQKGIINLTNGFNEPSPLLNPQPEQIINKFSALQLLKSKSTCLYKKYNSSSTYNYLETAIKTAQLSMQIIDDLRNSYLSRESKLQLAEHEDETYKLALDMCFLAYKLTDDEKYSHLAFYIAEKTKSSVLLSSLREMEAKEFGGIPVELLNKERVLSRKITFYQENIYEENQSISPDSVKISTWETYLFQEQKEHDELIQLFEKQYPEYFALKYNSEIVGTKALGKILKGTTLVEYALSDSALYIFLIERSKFLIHKEKINVSFFDLVQNYLSQFQEFDFSKQSYSSFTEFCWQSKELYNYLIKPFGEEISNDHLLIVPEGVLSYIPFETLILQVPPEIPNHYYRSLPYLLYDYAVSYSYSSTLFQQVYTETQARGKKKLAAFAPEYTMDTAFQLSDNGHIITRQKYRKNLYPIPGVLEEIDEISKIVASDIFTGQEASETAFRRVAGKYDLLHLAMHTVVDNNNPMFSKLIFTDTPDSINDGLLNTFEIFGLRLRARMVVLSACSTGEGDYSNGEGVMSLARGFVYAGSPSLIMTMWEIEDKTSIILMKKFYQNLIRGQNKAKALQQAKVEFIKQAKPENTHPFFWSSYVVLGNTHPIAWKPRAIIFLGIIVLITITILGIVGTKFYKHRAKTNK